MATRLYFHNAANTLTGALPSGEQSSALPQVVATGANFGSTMKVCDFNIGASQVSNSMASHASVGSVDSVLGVWVSSPLQGAQTVGGGSIHINGADSESNTSANFWMNGINAYVWRPSTNILVGTIRDYGSTPLGGLEATSANSEQVTDITGITSTGISAADGDVIVVEIWTTSNQSMSSSYTDILYYDGTTENTTENAVVSSQASFVEFAEDLVFKPQYTPTSGYPSVKAVGVLDTASATASNTPWPAGHAAGDVGVLIIVSNTTMSAPSGWTTIASIAGTNVVLICQRTATSSSESNAVITFSSTVYTAQIVTFSNAGALLANFPSSAIFADAFNSSTTATSNVGNGPYSSLTSGNKLGVTFVIGRLARAVGNVKSLTDGSNTYIKVSDVGCVSGFTGPAFGVFVNELAGTTWAQQTATLISSSNTIDTVQILFPAAPAGSVASSSGTSAPTATGASTAASSASSAGTSTPTATGKSTANSVASSAGTATVTGGGSQLITAAASSAGTSTVSATGVGAALGVASSVGTSTVSATGKSNAASPASAVGTSTVSAVGTGLVPATASSVGTSTVSAQSGSSIAQGSIAGTSTVSGVGKAITNSVANSVGVATDSVIGKATTNAVMSAVCNANLNGVGKSTTNSVATAAGTSVPAAVGIAASTTVGTSAGTSSVAAVGTGISAAIASASGIGTATAVGLVIGFASGDGLAQGTSSDSVIGAALGIAYGTVVCTSNAQATAKQLGWAKGAPIGKTWTQEDVAL